MPCATASRRPDKESICSRKQARFHRRAFFMYGVDVRLRCWTSLKLNLRTALAQGEWFLAVLNRIGLFAEDNATLWTFNWERVVSNLEMASEGNVLRRLMAWWKASPARRSLLFRASGPYLGFTEDIH